MIPAEDHGSQAALRLIVIERDARVVEKAREAAPQSEQVPYRLVKGEIRPEKKP